MAGDEAANSTVDFGRGMGPGSRGSKVTRLAGDTEYWVWDVGGRG